MAKKEKTSDAVKILHGRYVKDDPERKASLEAERVNAEVAQLIYDLRKEAGLTQGELADLVGTTQSVISRLEDADYDGHSLSMLNRIARALNQKLTAVMTAAHPGASDLRFAFQQLVRMTRRAKKLTVEELAERIDVDPQEIVALERHNGYRPSPLTLHKLSGFFGIPEKRLATLAGAFGEVPQDVSEGAVRFAAQSDSPRRLTKEEKKLLDEFVASLKTGP